VNPAVADPPAPATRALFDGVGLVHPFDLDLESSPEALDLFAEEVDDHVRVEPTASCACTLSTVLCDCLETLSTIYCYSAEPETE
jgi:hypothetical protein